MSGNVIFLKETLVQLLHWKTHAEEITKCVVVMESVFVYMDTNGMGIPKNVMILQVMVNGHLYSVTFNFFFCIFSSSWFCSPLSLFVTVYMHKSRGVVYWYAAVKNIKILATPVILYIKKFYSWCYLALPPICILHRSTSITLCC